jgi:hypothetical protein
MLLLLTSVVELDAAYIYMNAFLFSSFIYIQPLGSPQKRRKQSVLAGAAPSRFTSTSILNKVVHGLQLYMYA